MPKPLPETLRAEIRRAYARGEKQAAIARRFKVSQAAVSRVLSGGVPLRERRCPRCGGRK